MTPKHYDNQQQYDVIDIIKDYDLNFNEGNAVKYIVRARRKGAHLDDLRKAIRGGAPGWTPSASLLPVA